MFESRYFYIKTIVGLVKSFWIFSDPYPDDIYKYQFYYLLTKDGSSLNSHLIKLV